MRKKIIFTSFLISTILLQSCGTDEKITETPVVKNIEKKAEEVIADKEPLVNSGALIEKEVKIKEETEEAGNQLEEIELGTGSLDKLEQLMKIDTDFYLFKEDKSAQGKKEILIKDIKELLSGKYIKRDNDGTPYTVATYKKSRNKKVDNYVVDSKGNTSKKGFISVIDNELKSAKSILTDIKKEDFATREDFNQATGEVISIEISSTEVEKEYNKFLLESKTKLIELEKEKKALESGKGIEEFIYQDKASLKGLLTSKQSEYRKIIKKELEKKVIEKVKSDYIKELNNINTKFDIKEVNYIIDNVLLKKDINKDNYIYLEKSDIEKIIKNFEEGNLTKITKKLNGGIQISSEILYLKNTDTDGNTYYVDEIFYLNAKKSLNNGYKNFIVYTQDYEKEYNTAIYHFLTGYDKNKSYYMTLTDLIINNLRNDLFIQLTNATVKLEKNKEGVEYNSYTPNLKKDIKEKGLLINTFMSALGKKQLEGYNQYQMKELLENLK